jgi:hypothetical protein
MFVKEPLLEQVRLRLQQGLTSVFMAQHSIKIMKDERIPPGSGEEFINVYGGEVTPLVHPSAITRNDSYGFTIGITRRTLAVPNELMGETVMTYDEAWFTRTKPSMYSRAEQIIELMNEQNGWMFLNAVNAIVGPVGCFLVPFGLTSIDPNPREVGPEHFDIQDSEMQYVGLLLELEFGGAEYLKPT